MKKIILTLFVLLGLYGCIQSGSEIGNPTDPRDGIPKSDTIPGEEYSSFIPYSSASTKDSLVKK